MSQLFSRLYPACFFVTLLLGSSLAQASATHRILHIGDSHSVGFFGRMLNAELRSLPETEVTFVGSCGAVASSYFTGWSTHCWYFEMNPGGEVIDEKVHRTPRIKDLLARSQPTLTVVELSTNYLVGWTKERAIADMEKLAQTVTASGGECLWVSGPDTRKFHARQPEMLDWVKAAVSNYCTVVDGLETTHYPDQGGDGIHYGNKKSVSAWVAQVFEAVKRAL